MIEPSVPASKILEALSLQMNNLTIHICAANVLRLICAVVLPCFATLNAAEGPPSILTQPQSQIVSVGESVQFSVTANGTLPITYQWKKDEVAIVGAVGSSFSISKVQYGDTGVYAVEIRNAFGVSRSDLAALTVGGTEVLRVYNPSRNDLVFRLTTPTKLGWVYVVEVSELVGGSEWRPLAVLLGNGRAQTFADSEFGYEQRFYRLVGREFRRSGDQLRFGADDRLDIIDEPNPIFRDWARSVCAVIHTNQITTSPSGESRLLTSTWAQDYGYPLCADQRFVNQPLAAFATAFLLAPDIIATAGHVIRNPALGNGNARLALDIAAARFVFGFQMLNQTLARTSFTPDQVYTAKRLLLHDYSKANGDYAILQLDRPVTVDGAVPLRIREQGEISLETEVGLIGHGLGLPAKTTFSSSSLAFYTNKFKFFSSADTFGGNSGGPVFNALGGFVEGIHVTGGDDYYFDLDPATRCLKLLSYQPVGANSYWMGAGAMKITSIPGLVDLLRQLPGISRISPSSGPAGESVVITGARFTGTMTVKFAGANAEFKLDSDTQITATVPSSATSGPITVTTSAGTATSSNFEVVPVLNAPPTISTIPDQATNEDTPAKIEVTVSDDRTPVGDLKFAFASSNQALAPESNMSLGGNGAHRTLSISPTSDQFGSASITMTVTDGDGEATSRAFFLTVRPVNDAPSLSLVSDQTISGTTSIELSDITAGAINETQVLKLIAISSNPSLIATPVVSYTSPNTTGSIRLSPVAGRTGESTITVFIEDDGGTANFGQNVIARSFKVSVASVVAPTSVEIVHQGPTEYQLGAALEISNRFQYTGQLLSLLWKPQLPTGWQLLSAVAVEGGQVELNPTKTGIVWLGALPPSPVRMRYTIQAPALATGPVQIRGEVEYQFSGTANPAISFATPDPLTLTPLGNRPPAAIAQSVTTLEDVASSVVLAGSDADGDTLSFVVLSKPAKGNLSGSGQNLTYTPARNETGTDSFTFQVSDGKAVPAPATVSLIITPVNDAPTLDSLDEIAISTPRTLALTGITPGPADETAQGLSVTASSSNPTLLAVSVSYASPSSTGTLTLTPTSGQSGTAIVTVRVQDNGGTANGGQDTFTQTLTVRVNVPLEQPQLVVAPLNLIVTEGQPASFSVRLTSAPASSVNVMVVRTSGDSDLSVVNVAPLTFTPANWSANQTVTLAAALDADTANGSASFTVSASGLTPVTVTATEADVTLVNSPPTVAITAPTSGATFVNPASFTLEATATDDKSVVRVEFFMNAASVGVDTLPPYAQSFTLGVGTHTLRAVATDNEGASSVPAEISVTVQPKPGRIEFVSGSYQVDESAGSPTLTVRRVDGTDGPVSVSYATLDGTAKAGADYTFTSGVLQWPSGQGGNRSISVTISNDSSTESMERFFVKLGNPSGGATITGEAAASIWITDDDASTGPFGRVWDRSFGGASNEFARAICPTPEGGVLVAGYVRTPTEPIEPVALWGDDDGLAVFFSSSGEVIRSLTFGATSHDYLYAAVPVAAGGYLLAGTTGDSPIRKNFGGYDFWVVRIDAVGNKLWEQSYGGVGVDWLNSVTATSDGGFLLVGSSDSGAGGNKAATNYGASDLWIVRIDSQGNKLWDRGFGGSQYEYNFPGVRETKDKGFIIVGDSNSSGTDGNKTSPFRTDWQVDAWIIRLDTMGNKVWEQSFGGIGGEGAVAVEELAEGGFIVLGTSTSVASGSKTAPLYGLPHAGTGYGSHDYWLMRLNSAGEKMWEKTYGGEGVDIPFGLGLLPGGGYVLAGYSHSGVSGSADKGNKTTPNLGENDYWIVRTDTDGNKVAEQTFGGSGRDEPYGLVVLSDGSVVIAGHSNSPPGPAKSAATVGETDVWVVKLGRGQ